MLVVKPPPHPSVQNRYPPARRIRLFYLHLAPRAPEIWGETPTAAFSNLPIHTHTPRLKSRLGKGVPPPGPALGVFPFKPISWGGGGIKKEGLAFSSHVHPAGSLGRRLSAGRGQRRGREQNPSTRELPALPPLHFPRISLKDGVGEGEAEKGKRRTGQRAALPTPAGGRKEGKGGEPLRKRCCGRV